MSDYFLGTADGSRMYRIAYDVQQAAGGTQTFAVRSCHVTGVQVVLPSGSAIGDAFDVQITTEEVLVDLALGNVAAASVDAYRAAAKAVIDGQW